MKRKSEPGARKRWKTIPVGTLISIAWAAMMCALTAVLVIKELVSEKLVEYVVLSILMISSYVGVKYNGTQDENSRNSSYLSGLLFWLVLLAINAASGIPYDNVGIKMAAIAAGSILGSIKMKRKGRGNARSKHRRYR